MFNGCELVEDGRDPLPAQIIFFLENVWDHAEGDENMYREEIRVTFLHEAGHFLGLEEMDLEDRWPEEARK